jgi:hypothetical protein
MAFLTRSNHLFCFLREAPASLFLTIINHQHQSPSQALTSAAIHPPSPNSPQLHLTHSNHNRNYLASLKIQFQTHRPTNQTTRNHGISSLTSPFNCLQNSQIPAAITCNQSQQTHQSPATVILQSGPSDCFIFLTP